MLTNIGGIQTEPMHHREIILADGRYMIFYTFGDLESEDPGTGDVSERETPAADHTPPINREGKD